VAGIAAATTVADDRIAAVDDPTVVADVPIVAGAPAGRGSNAVPAAHDMTEVIRADIPGHRVVRNSFPKC
jgi:hypothetical protein